MIATDADGSKRTNGRSSTALAGLLPAAGSVRPIVAQRSSFGKEAKERTAAGGRRVSAANPGLCRPVRPLGFVVQREGRFPGVTAFAVEFKTQEGLAACGRQNPGAKAQGRLMAHVLAVPTGQHGHPIACFILTPTDDSLLHGPDQGKRTKASAAAS
jgi:hypothetical protein